MELAGLSPAGENTVDGAAASDEAAQQPASAVGADWFSQQDAAATRQSASDAPVAPTAFVPAFAEETDEEYDVDDHPASVEFWGVVAPITEWLILNYQRRTATFRILDFETEEEIIDIVNAAPFHMQKMVEARSRLYYALLAIDGKKTLLPGEARAAWIRKIPGPFVDALLMAYDLASKRPTAELDRIVSDPSSDAARLQSGAF